jgi:hypothetical protein
MSAPGVGLVGGLLVALLVVAAYEWARITVAAYRLAASWLRAEGARPHTSPSAADGGVSQGAQHRPPQGVDGPRSGGYR